MNHRHFRTDHIPERSAREATGIRSDERGLSEVVAFAVLLGIVILGIAVILLVGVDLIDREQSDAEFSQAEQALTKLDTEARVTLQENTTRQVDLGLRGVSGDLAVNPERGWIRVEHQQVDLINGSVDETTVLTNRSLGAVVYQEADSSVAYQGGGVWRGDGSGSVMVSRPDIQFRQGTLSLSVIGVASGEGVYGDVEVSRHDTTVHPFPNETAGLTNRVNDTTVSITVQSEYYLAWGKYLEDDLDAVVGYDHDEQIVHAEFIAVPTAFSLRSGIIATAAPGDISLHGTGAYVTSYNSTTGERDTREGSVQAVGDVLMWGNAEIAGDVYTGDRFEIASGAASVDGDVAWTTSFENHGTVTGTDRQITGVPSIPPITGFVIDEVRSLRLENDNEAAPAVIDDDELSFNGRQTLEAGSYYLETMHVDRNDEIVLDTTDGDIHIGVRDWIGIEQRADVTVEGTGTVHVYVEGREKVFNDGITGAEDHVPSTEWTLYVDRGAEVTTPNDNASQLRIYGTDTFTGGVGGPQDTVVTGVIYAPAGQYGPGFFYIKQAHLFGAVVTGDLTVDQSGEIHYDLALEDQEFPVAPTVPRLEYLYVSEHGLAVDSP